MAPQLSRKRIAEEATIPDRLYFKIGDVARICQVETYVLRFWETQFPQLKPNKSGTGQRLYRRRDVETALEIKRLVHGQGYTLVGARQAMTQNRRPAEPPEPQTAPEPVVAPAAEPAAPKANAQAASAIDAARRELRAILDLLGATSPEAAAEGAAESAAPRRKSRPREAQPEATNLLFPV